MYQIALKRWKKSRVLANSQLFWEVVIFSCDRYNHIYESWKWSQFSLSRLSPVLMYWLHSTLSMEVIWRGEEFGVNMDVGRNSSLRGSLTPSELNSKQTNGCFSSTAWQVGFGQQEHLKLESSIIGKVSSVMWEKGGWHASDKLRRLWQKTGLKCVSEEEDRTPLNSRC